MGGGKYTDHEILNKVYDESTGGLKTSASGGGFVGLIVLGSAGDCVGCGRAASIRG